MYPKVMYKGGYLPFAVYKYLFSVKDKRGYEQNNLCTNAVQDDGGYVPYTVVYDMKRGYVDWKEFTKYYKVNYNWFFFGLEPAQDDVCLPRHFFRHNFVAMHTHYLITLSNKESDDKDNWRDLLFLIYE